MYYLRSSENKKKDLAFFFLGPGLISASPYFRKSKKATVLLYHKIIFREIYCTGVITLHSEHTKHVNLAFLFLTLNMTSQDCFVTRRTVPNIWNGAFLQKYWIFGRVLRLWQEWKVHRRICFIITERLYGTLSFSTVK